MSKYYLPFEKEYEKLYKKIKDSKDIPYNFNKKFEDQGKQGTVGLLDMFNRKCVFKCSQYYNHLVRHEFEIMKSLRSIRKSCPHFCLGYKVLTFDADFDYRKKENPFLVSRKKSMKNEAILMQWIKNSKDFTDFISYSGNEKVIYSSVKQILCALSIAQNKLHFCHYDLHSSNVLMSKCDPELSLVYVLDKDNTVCVPTFGYIPKIIDYGFSYTKKLEKKTFYGTLAHTDVGFMSCTNDFMMDLKLFLVTVSYDVHHHHNSNTAKTFRNVIKNIFEPLDIDWESGWDRYTRSGAADQILEKIEDFYDGSKLFEEYDFHCIDLFQTLIKLPLQNHSTKNLEVSFKTFIQEFKKIEEQIQNPIINMYLLRKLIDLARIIKKFYLREKNETIKFFKMEFLKIVDKLASFCNIKNLNYERLLCSIYVFSECCEGLLYNSVREKIQESEDSYTNLKLRTPEQMYACLEINLPSKKTYTKSSKFLILDTIHNDRAEITNLPDFVLGLLNMTHPMNHGKILFDYITKKLDHKIELFEELQNLPNSPNPIQRQDGESVNLNDDYNPVFTAGNLEQDKNVPIILDEEEEKVEEKVVNNIEEEEKVEEEEVVNNIEEIVEEEEVVNNIEEKEIVEEEIVNNIEEDKKEIVNNIEEEEVVNNIEEEEVEEKVEKPKKRGRPKKTQSVESQPKKRGRPKKTQSVEAQPKKRGRPKKNSN